MKSMEESYRSDQADMRRMRDLTLTIEDFLDDPPSRCDPALREQLKDTVAAIRSRCAQIVARWD